jgi:type IV secretion system protein VirB5
MPALHKTVNYKPADIPNPFLEGQDRAYADILRDKMDEMKWWRGVIGTGMLVLFAAAVILFLYAIGLQKTVPVLVNVMPSGEAQYLGEVRRDAEFAVPETAVQFQIRSFIHNLRSVSADPQVLYDNIERCYAMVTSAYEPALTRFLRSASPFDLAGKTRRTVEVESVLKITPGSYQIDWTETETSGASARPAARMRAVVTVKLLPVTGEAVKRNPLGIYIESCEMTRL